MIPFRPLFRNPHLQTIASHFWQRPRTEHAIERRIIETEPGVCVLVESQRPEAAVGEIVMLHGLEGSGKAGSIESLAAAALRFGYAAHRFHMRTCGGTAAPFAHPVPRRIDRRSGRRTAHLPPGGPRAGLPRGLLAGRKRGAEAGRRTGRFGRGTHARRLRRVGAARPGGLRAAHRRSRQSPVRAPLRA